MRFLSFATRNLKELLRDPLSLVFGIGLPIILLLLMSTIQKNAGVELFKLETFTPGIIIFSFSFISLFSGMLLSKDRCSSFLTRLFASPLSALDFIVGYSLPLLLIAFIQSLVCLIAAFFLGLPFNTNVLLTIPLLIPIAILFIGLGLLFGCIFNDKQVGGIASILVNVATLTSGMWFDLNLIGETLKTIAYTLPFAHGIDSIRGALTGDFSSILPHFVWVLAYSIIIYILSILIFRKKMLKGNN